MSNPIYLDNLMIEVDENVKNLSLTLSSTHQIKLNGLPLISTTRLCKQSEPRGPGFDFTPEGWSLP